jgi:type II protein arginine methyltransferase
VLGERVQTQLLGALREDLSNRFLLASVQGALDSAQQSMGLIRAMLQADRENTDPADIALSSAIPTVPRWHFAMLNDLERNEAFAVALDNVVPQGAHVLDIGSGTGLLSMMVARAGAASVTTCEQNPTLAELARQIVARHGLSDVITIVPKMSTDLVVGVDLPRRADLIVSEIVDCGLVGEGVLPTVRHAREHLLAPGGRLLPESARIFGTLVDSVAVDRLNRVRFAGGFDVGLLNGLATRGHFPVRLSTWPHRLLSAATELHSFDFAAGALTDGSTEADVEVTVAGTAHGLAVWFDLTLGGGVLLRNSPDNPGSHWMQAFVQFDEPVDLTVGERVQFEFCWQDTRLSVRKINISAMAKGK